MIKSKDRTIIRNKFFNSLEKDHPMFLVYAYLVGLLEGDGFFF